MTDEARRNPEVAAYRGFLFSDMRGFTAFGERYGNAAAAAAVASFLEIARKAIARHEGAEISTEGDAIHAVFPSASGAVLCGLDIVDGAAELNAQQPDRPLGLGVGVHAGEAVETAEGYIGRAVNIAARLSAIARPGEVLVSSTVKGITQASIPVGFLPRGRRRLKGIQDPILVYAVTRDMTARASRVRLRPATLAAAGAAVLVVIVASALVGSRLMGTAGASPSTSTRPPAQPLVIGPVPIGTYRSTAFSPTITFAVVDPGWSATRDVPEMVSLIREGAPRGSVSLLRVQEVIANPCIEGGEGTHTGPAADDVLTLLGALDHLRLENRQPAQVGGYTGEQVDVLVSDASLAACGGPVNGGVALFLAGGEVWKATPGERFRLISFGVGGEAVTLLMSTDWSETPSVQELENLLKIGQRLIDSVEFSVAP